jgi:hypothetical protein
MANAISSKSDTFGKARMVGGLTVSGYKTPSIPAPYIHPVIFLFLPLFPSSKLP